MAANDRQVGGDHYKKGGEEHWDRAWRLKYDCFQYIITKWVERWKEKGGVEDLKKAHHALEKYIELIEAGDTPPILPVPEMVQEAHSEVKHGQWRGFVYEGGTAEKDHYTCKMCKQYIRIPIGDPPYLHHTH